VNLIHCSYHKCLTVYFARVVGALYEKIIRWGGGYKHCNSLLRDFYASLGDYRIISINNHMLALDRLGDFRITRFLRDPRDLVVSGYLYHKRGAEDWCNVVDPTPEDWEVVNGVIPEGLSAGQSFSAYLQSLSLEDGLLAELEFRRRHFESMRAWPDEHPWITSFRYEDIIGNEVDIYRRIFAFYELPRSHQWMAARLADYLSARRQKKRLKHIRNPRPHQWVEHFTPRVTACFEEQYGDLLDKLGYRDAVAVQ
jgi:hypothetical protein